MSLPAWATDPSSLLLTEEEYEALPEDVCRSIEVVDGRVVFCESPTPAHQRVSRNLTFALLRARPEAPCLDVLQDTDMRYRHRNPHVTQAGKRFTFRRPDICVLRCLLPGARLWSGDVLVAVEITSSDDEVDFNDKRAEYAAQGILAYLIVVMDGDGIGSVEEHRLDWSGRNYQLAAVHRGSLVTELPEGLKIDISFVELEQV
ncbi:Uma2 family endonuclease [Sphaerimonospora cavernae]|uniref:Uma2 family endonuclease n=1 Tax=Sphaerimonospora cavernae TaxID=1740611 RepID=A0ABV6UD84_9ACTN